MNEGHWMKGKVFLVMLYSICVLLCLHIPLSSAHVGVGTLLFAGLRNLVQPQCLLQVLHTVYTLTGLYVY